MEDNNWKQNKDMEYKLAKKLKDAGFPQEFPSGGDGFYVNGGLPDEIYVPTLSELIEACGEKFGALELFDYKDWVAGGMGKNGVGFKIGGFKTPEDAVANLWLELNGIKSE